MGKPTLLSTLWSNDLKVWVNFTEGGEYSPHKIPDRNEVSAVRLDKDGKQRLYRYNLSNGESTELIKTLVVAYYTWFDENTIVSAVIEEQQLNLFATNLSQGTSRKYVTKVGRSFHNIPNSNLVSFISKENESQWQIKSIDPKTGVTKLIANTLDGVEDICWLNNKTILSAKGPKLFKLTLNKDNNWREISDLTSYGITEITRLAVNPSMTRLAIAANFTPEDKRGRQQKIINKTTATHHLQKPQRILQGLKLLYSEILMHIMQET